MNDEGQDKASSYSWYALGVLFLVYVVNFVDRQILSILANDIKADLQVDDAFLGFLYGTAFAIFYALFGIPLGRLADSWSRTRLLALGLTLWSLMTALSGFARNGASGSARSSGTSPTTRRARFAGASRRSAVSSVTTALRASSPTAPPSSSTRRA